MPNDERIVPRDELPDWCKFQASLSDHPIVLVEGGERLGQHYRYKQTLPDEHADLNEMWRDYRAGKRTREWMMQYYRDIGYSLNGYEEIWGGELNAMQRKIAFERPIEEMADDWQTLNLADYCIELAKTLSETDDLDIESDEVIAIISMLRIAAHRLGELRP